MTSHHIPLETLLSHRAPSLYIDGLISADATHCRTYMVVSSTALYADENGHMPGWFGLELMAQCISTYSGHLRRQHGKGLELGYLLGTQHYDCMRSHFPAGTRLEIEANVIFQDGEGLSAFDCVILEDDQIVAKCVLKVFEKP